MDDLSASFVNEAHELLENLEEALLKLEDHPEDEEQINTAFRVMHSLKGTGAMFGFEELSAFTHEMESLYDLVRTGKRKADRQLIDFTFKSIDLIRQLLEKPEDPGTRELKNELLKELSAKFKQAATPSGTPGEAPPQKAVKTPPQKPAATWHIRFEPHREILQNGTRPLYLLDELAEAGKLKSFLHTENIPDFEHLIAENVYVWWDLLLVTDKDENFIRDVFIFVEDESHIEIRKVADDDLLSPDQAEQVMKNLGLEEAITAEKLETFVRKMAAAENRQSKNLPEKETTPSSSPVPEKEKAKTVSTGKPPGTPGPIKEKTVSPPELQETVRVSSAKLDDLLDIISELVTTQARLLHYSQKHDDPELQNITEAYEKLSRRLRENALDMRLIPIYTILIRFKRLIRDLSSKLNKQVTLQTTGTETELDKSIIEKLYDPLMHIIRNSIDHGIEPSRERIQAGKPPKGLIRIDTSYSGANVKIKVTDDGRGMSDELLKNTAIRKGLILPDQEISHKELLQMIFLPGFTTSQKVSNVSGRGVGMDVVKKNIEELRGTIEIDTEKGKGTAITIILPLTLSIIDGLLVYIGPNRYLIPIENVKRIYPVTRKEIEKTLNRVITKDKKQIPFVDLVQEFKETDTVDRNQEMYLVVTDYGSEEMGFVIHSIVGKYQAVIKPLSHIVQKQEIFSGASILGDGGIALVIDTNKTINKFINRE